MRTDSIDPQISPIHADSSRTAFRTKTAKPAPDRVAGRSLHYSLAESCFSEEVLRFPVKSANLRNLRIKTVRCFGCGLQAALRNLRIHRFFEAFWRLA
jgi:hypothetical protein